jgi:uncharacterized protein YjbJ (UPF0337 family)
VDKKRLIDPGYFSMQDNNLTTLWDPVLRQSVRTSFESLTDDDVARIDGNAETFLQVLQTRYGYTLDEAQSAMDTFMRRYNSFDNSQAGAAASAQPDNTAREVF